MECGGGERRRKATARVLESRQSEYAVKKSVSESLT